ncbi:hypothetical protein CR155_03320 [Pollutimonas nitritireducens]|uniref:Tetratricopeptide repeat protein n=1 Tax=Pollutimonas nitritireducens TaxID=2045209 RepID=A0A2N4UJS8_9BURK|nr:tetratricopeptide repeat protein [Pollutimonas nitritireducens]PLC55250.1 hypothetical protein CR155_03320 [Pollutimonas nitritireducens]
MFRIYCPVLAIALFTGGLSVQTAGAQTLVPGLEPHVDLNATLDAGPDAPAFSSSGGILIEMGRQPQTANEKLFNDTQPPEGGWKGLARLLEAITPSVDTEIPLTPSEITSRISAMIDRGETREALQVINKRAAQLDAQGGLGSDVQLMFLRGRALAALGSQAEAIDLYLEMTTLYPELPEPWNNLAAEYVKQGKLEMARDALAMALSANPNYATAQANMGEVQLMLARQSFQSAAQLGIGDAGGKARATTELLKNNR